MHLWSITALARELEHGRVTEKQGMYYFLASSLLVLFGMYYSLWWGVVRDGLFYLQLVTVLLITIFGCIKAFEANAGNDGRDFVIRAICLSVPVGVRVTVFFVLFGVPLYLYAGDVFTPMAFADPVRAFNLVSYLGVVGFNIYYWWLLVNGIEKAAGSEK